MTLTFDLLTQKCIGVFLSSSSIYVWSMKSLCWKVFELSWHNNVWGICKYDLDLWPFDPKMYRCLPFFILYLWMKYKVSMLKSFWVIVAQQCLGEFVTLTLTFDLLTAGGICHYDLDLWPFDPKLYRCLPFFILYLCMKYEVSMWKSFWVIVAQPSCGRTDRRTDKVITIGLPPLRCIGVFLSSSCVCVWNINFYVEKFLSYHGTTKLWTDGQTDRQSDYYRAPASSMAGP